MKLAAQILLFVFMTFLATPTIVSVIKKNVDTTIFYNFAEEEKGHKEIKAVFSIDTTTNPILFLDMSSSLILSENLSKHDKITYQIFIPPPEIV